MRPTATAGDDGKSIVITFDCDNGGRVISQMDLCAAGEFVAELQQAVATIIDDGMAVLAATQAQSEQQATGDQHGPQP